VKERKRFEREIGIREGREVNRQIERNERERSMRGR